MLKVVHLDDNLIELKNVERLLLGVHSPYKFQIESFHTTLSFRERLKANPLPDIALIDIHLQDNCEESGISIAAEIRVLYPDIIVIIFSSDLEQTTLAASAGVHDYIDKDTDGKALAERLFFNYQTKRPEIDAQESAAIIGNTIKSLSPKIQRIKKSAVKTVHIYGETGCGKEIVAKLFKPKRILDCGAIPENLIESELFGFKRGAFTGALQDKKGALDLDSGEWIFLDEIANISLATQAKLLRAIGEMEINPIGANESKKINFRLITATNVDLKEKVEQGEFREDLRQRLTEFEVYLPPLRERLDEIDKLIDHFCQTLEGGPYTIESQARKLLKSFDYQKGNIRELRRALVTMTASKLPGNILPYNAVPKHIVDGVIDMFGLNASNNHIQQIKDNHASEELTVIWRPGENWESYWKRCLLAAIRLICKDKAKSYRELAPILGMQRTTLSKKISEMMDEAMLTDEEARQLFKGSA